MKEHQESFIIADKIVRALVQSGNLVPRPDDATPCQECIAQSLRENFQFTDPPKPELEVEEDE